MAHFVRHHPPKWCLVRGESFIAKKTRKAAREHQELVDKSRASSSGLWWTDQRYVDQVVPAHFVHPDFFDTFNYRYQVYARPLVSIPPRSLAEACDHQVPKSYNVKRIAADKVWVPGDSACSHHWNKQPWQLACCPPIRQGKADDCSQNNNAPFTSQSPLIDNFVSMYPLQDHCTAMYKKNKGQFSLLDVGSLKNPTVFQYQGFGHSRRQHSPRDVNNSVKKDYVCTLRSPRDVNNSAKKGYVCTLRSPRDVNNSVKKDYVCTLHSTRDVNNSAKKDYVCTLHSTRDVNNSAKKDYVCTLRATGDVNNSAKKDYVCTLRSPRDVNNSVKKDYVCTLRATRDVNNSVKKDYVCTLHSTRDVNNSAKKDYVCTLHSTRDVNNSAKKDYVCTLRATGDVNNSAKKDYVCTLRATGDVNNSAKKDYVCTLRATRDVNNSVKKDYVCTLRATGDLNNSVKKDYVCTLHSTRDVNNSVKKDYVCTLRSTRDLNNSVKKDYVCTLHSTRDVNNSVKKDYVCTLRSTRDINNSVKKDYVCTLHSTRDLNNSVKKGHTSKSHSPLDFSFSAKHENNYNGHTVDSRKYDVVRSLYSESNCENSSIIEYKEMEHCCRKDTSACELDGGRTESVPNQSGTTVCLAACSIANHSEDKINKDTVASLSCNQNNNRRMPLTNESHRMVTVDNLVGTDNKGISNSSEHPNRPLTVSHSSHFQPDMYSQVDDITALSDSDNLWCNYSLCRNNNAEYGNVSDERPGCVPRQYSDCCCYTPSPCHLDTPRKTLRTSYQRTTPCMEMLAHLDTRVKPRCFRYLTPKPDDRRVSEVTLETAYEKKMSEVGYRTYKIIGGKQYCLPPPRDYTADIKLPPHLEEYREFTRRCPNPQIGRYDRSDPANEMLLPGSIAANLIKVHRNPFTYMRNSKCHLHSPLFYTPTETGELVWSLPSAM